MTKEQPLKGQLKLLQVIVWKGRNSHTVHHRPDGTAKRNFDNNRKHFVSSVDFYRLTQPSEIRTLGLERPQGGVAKEVILLTETGYLMLVKSFTDDLAWKG